MNDAAPKRRPTTRSPNYPSIDLRRAIERVRTLYESERQHPIPALQAVRHWGYSSLNSPGGGQLAALARFGLLDDEGVKDDRRVTVTDLAVKILVHPDPLEREAAIRTAAMLPAVHQDMWQTYGSDLPSEETLKWFLTRDRGFSENGAKDFVKEYRATIEFAKPNSEADAALDESQDEAGAPTAVEADPPATVVGPSAQVPTERAASVASPSAGPVVPPISFPLASGKLVTVAGLSDLTEVDWAQFIAVLTALKPSLVKGAAFKAPDEN
jgi:hypothetical protein